MVGRKESKIAENFVCVVKVKDGLKQYSILLLSKQNKYSGVNIPDTVGCWRNKKNSYVHICDKYERYTEYHSIKLQPTLSRFLGKLPFC